MRDLVPLRTQCGVLIKNVFMAIGGKGCGRMIDFCHLCARQISRLMCIRLMRFKALANCTLPLDDGPACKRLTGWHCDLNENFNAHRGTKSDRKRCKLAKIGFWVLHFCVKAGCNCGSG